jgi:phenylacetate-CoA ligase
MLIVKGVNVYPSAVEDVLRAIPGFGGEFRIITSGAPSIDRLVVRAEHASSGAADESTAAAEVARILQARIGVRATVLLTGCGTIERTEFKSRRVVEDHGLFEKLSRGDT